MFITSSILDPQTPWLKCSLTVCTHYCSSLVTPSVDIDEPQNFKSGVITPEILCLFLVWFAMPEAFLPFSLFPFLLDSHPSSRDQLKGQMHQIFDAIPPYFLRTCLSETCLCAFSFFHNLLSFLKVFKDTVHTMPSHGKLCKTNSSLRESQYWCNDTISVIYLRLSKLSRLLFLH